MARKASESRRQKVLLGRRKADSVLKQEEKDRGKDYVSEGKPSAAEREKAYRRQYGPPPSRSSIPDTPPPQQLIPTAKSRGRRP